MEVLDKFNPEKNNGLSKLEKIDYQEAQRIYNKFKNKLSEIYKSGDRLIKENNELNIGVVGQVKAGKSSFLNSLMFDGETVLPKASTPMTAGLTVLRYGTENRFEIEYYNNEEWSGFVKDAQDYDDAIAEYRKNEPEISKELTDNQIAKSCGLGERFISAKEMVDKCCNGAKRKIKEKSQKDVEPFTQINELQDKLNKYVGADGSYTSVVKNLVIYLNDERLEGIQIVDTPGVNDPVVSRENKTREYLQSCHGVFFLSYAGRFFDSTDVSFLTDRIGSQGIGEVVVLASKYDSALQDEGNKFEDNLPLADKTLEDKLQKRLYEQIPDSYNRKDPLFDVTSGIGFSIAKKNVNDYDEIEKHVLSRMKHFYPSYFEDDEFKETFMDLSNIKTIKEKYLEEVFKNNKEEIIRNKIDDFITGNTINIQNEIKEELKKLNIKKEQLNKSDLKTLDKEKKSQEKLFGGMESEIKKIIKEKIIQIELYKKELKKNEIINFSVPKTIATTTHKRTAFWAWRSFEASYDVVDTYKMKKKLKELVVKYNKDIGDEWRNLIEKILEDIKVKINNFINKNEKENAFNFDSEYYYSLVTNTIYDFKIMSELELSEEKKKILEVVEDISDSQANVYRPRYSQEGKSVSEVKYKLQDRATDKINKIEKNILSSVLKPMNELFIKKAREESNYVNDKLNDLEKGFVDKIKENGTTHINKLKEEIQDLEKNLKNLDTTLKAVEMLK